MKMVMVRRSDLETLATFQCDRVSEDSKITCEQAEPKYQPLCNSCWARTWAMRELAKGRQGRNGGEELCRK